MSSKINESLSSLLTPLTDLREDPENARAHDDRNIKSIKDSLTAFGQQKPIVVTVDGKIIAGNGTFVAAKELGWKEIAALRFDNENAALQTAYAIADNKTAELASWNWAILSDQFSNLPDGLIESTGFSNEEIDALIANSDWEGVSDFGVPPPEDYKGQQFVRMRIVEDSLIEPVMRDLKELAVKYDGNIEIL